MFLVICHLHFFPSPESGIDFEVVAAIDINTTTNKIYRHNFPGTYLMENGIEVMHEILKRNIMIYEITVFAGEGV